MKILSLFDGMACGMLAFHGLGIDVEKYDAYEIDQYAMKVAQHNFPMIEEHGDVFKEDFTRYKGQVDFVVGGSPCFTAGHMVLTDKGYKPIEEIEVGDMVLTHKNRFRKVLATGNKVAPVRRLKVGSCLELTGTETHPFPTRDQYSAYKPSTRGMVKALTDVNRVEMKDFVPDKSHLGINCLQTSEDIPELTDEELWYYGRYIADGHCQIYKRKDRQNSYHYAVILSIGSKKLEDFLAHTPNMTYTSYSHTQSVYRVCTYSKDVCEKIEEFGFGRYADEKVIPIKFLNLPAERLKVLLEGYFSGDGCKIRNGMTCTTVSKELALSLQMAVLKVYGVNANITMPKITPTKVLEGRTINQRPQYVVTFHYTSSCSTRGRLVENQMWFPVTSVSEIIGEETVYNMTVDEDHSYTVNNICAFNCTYWSIAQSTDKRETTASGIGWELFSQYVRAVREAEPRYFVYENNKSMADEIRKSITETFGFEPIHINSALVSAQKRDRLYWVGIRNEDGTYRKAKIEQPEDRGILLKDVLDGMAGQEKARTMTASVGRTSPREYLMKHQNTMAAEPIPLHQTEDGKSVCLTSCYRHSAINNLTDASSRQVTGVAEPDMESVSENTHCLRMVRTEEGKELRKAYEAGEVHHGYNEYRRPDIREDGKTNTLTTVTKDNMIIEPTGIGERPHQVGVMPNENGNHVARQSSIIYDVEGKSRCLNANGGGMGAKTGLYAEPIPIHDTTDGKSYCLTAHYMKEGMSNLSDGNGQNATAIAEPIILNGTVDEKSKCLTANYWKASMANLKDDAIHPSVGIAEPLPTIQTDDGKALCMCASYGDASQSNMVGAAGQNTTGVAIPLNPTIDDKSMCLTAGYYKAGICNMSDAKGQDETGVAEPINMTEGGKAQCLRATCYKDGQRNLIGNDLDRKTAVAEPICYTLPQTVKVRKHEVDVNGLKSLLRSHRRMGFGAMAEKLGVPQTTVEHWFRKDDGFTIPDPSVWMELKSLLNIDTDEFDAQVMEFEERDGTYDKAERCYDTDGKYPTMVTGSNAPVIEPLDNDTKGFSMTGTFGNRHIGTSDKAYCLAANPSSDMNAKVIEPAAGRVVGRRIGEGGHRADNDLSVERVQRFEVNQDPEKTNCLTTVDKDNMVAEPVYAGGIKGRKVGGEWEQHLEVNSDPTKTNCITTVDKDNVALETVPINLTKDGEKAQCLRANYYKVNDRDIFGNNYDHRTGAATKVTSEMKDAYEVKDRKITYKGKQYPIKLPDGWYRIRKLSVDECKRLQTVPEWYDMTCISKTQAYKCLGNGWTIEVIKHLIASALNDNGDTVQTVTLDSF